MSDAPSSTSLVHVTGRLTMTTSGRWLKTILADKTTFQDVVCVDLSGVTDVDSSALAFVASVRRLMSEKGRKVEWLNVPSSVHNVANIYDAEAIFFE